jgi:integration host factor subunit alpha
MEIMMALTKHDIAGKVQAGLGFPKNQSVEITETLLELIKFSLESGDDVLVSGFGKFCVKKRRSVRGGIQLLVRMPFCQQDVW